MKYHLGIDHFDGGYMHVLVLNEEHEKLSYALCDFDKAVRLVPGELLDEGVALLCVPCTVAFTAEIFGKENPYATPHDGGPRNPRFGKRWRNRPDRSRAV